MIRARRLVAAAVLAAACGSPAPGRLEVGTASVDDRAEPSATAVLRIPVRNAGTGDLLLHDVRVGCGCRLTTPAPDVLAPGTGASFVVRCRRDVGDGPGDPNRTTAALVVTSSDPDRSETTVPLPVPRAPSFAQPRSLYFGYVALGGSAARDVVLPASAAAEHPAAKPPLTVEARPTRADGSRVVRVRFTPIETGPFRGELRLDDTHAPLPVSGVAYRKLLAFPAVGTVPSLVGGGPLTITVASTAAEPLTITSVDVPDGLAADVQSSLGHENRVVLHARGPHVALPAAIRIHTNDRDEPTVIVPLRDAGV